MKNFHHYLSSILISSLIFGSCVIAHLPSNENNPAPHEYQEKNHSSVTIEEDEVISYDGLVWEIDSMAVPQGDYFNDFNPHDFYDYLPVEYVNVFTGTGGHGHTYPGATYPFGMVQVSPDTRLDGWDGCGGYHYSDSIIYGFTHTHLQGTGVSDYGDILFMPTNGHVKPEPLWRDAIKSSFRHDTEYASPGSYTVHLDDYNIDVSLTATEHAAAHQYYLKSGDSCLLFLDFMHRDKLLYYDLHLYGDTAISGYRVSQGWAENQHTYFYAVFSKPFVANDQLMQRSTYTDEQDVKHVDLEMIQTFQFLFLPSEDNQLTVRIGLSGVDEEGAKNNLYAEIPQNDFYTAYDLTSSAWFDVLNKAPKPNLFQFGDEAQQQLERSNYYSALYHCYTVPNVWSDVDGRYRGMDNKIHQAEGYKRYTVFSLWDTFRAYHPMMCKLEPERTYDWMKTFLEMYNERGELPVWELAANETYCMIGYHSAPVIAEAYKQGIRFKTKADELRMLEALVATSNGPQEEKKAYAKMGYVPGDEFSESVSKTLEFAYDDFCIARYAEMIGKYDVAQTYALRSQNWKNVFDPETKFMRARVNGGFATPFDPYQVNFHYTEANAWQYRFFVPQDIPSLITYMGGAKAFENELDQLFSASTQTTGREQADITGLIGQYAHGNEPSHHMAYLYSFVNPAKVTLYRDSIMKNLYDATPEGLCGNEDCGQMSAWYVVSDWNTYPICPGDQSGWWINGPLSVQGNNEPEPSASLPIGIYSNKKITPAPIITAPAVSFVNNQLVTLSCLEKDARIEVEMTQNGKTIQFVYSKPITVSATCTLRARATGANSNYISSAWVEANFYKRSDNLMMKQAPSYDAQYTAGGNDALIDGVRGKLDFRTGTWQGYNGKMECVIELKKPTTIKKISLSSYQDIRPWIWFPSKVTFFVSKDGIAYDEVYSENFTEKQRSEGPQIHAYSVAFDQLYKGDVSGVKYVKCVALPAFDKIPDWHLGAGGKPWIFCDELIVE